MKLGRSLAIGVALLAGCTTTRSQVASGPVPIARGAATEFVPVVPAVSGRARCEVARRVPDGQAVRATTLVRDDPAARRITVMLDAEGAPTLYLDARGDLTPSARDGGDRTTIGLYLTQGYAAAGDRPAGQRPQIFELPLDEALDSENLGRPREMLELVLTRCGGTG